MKAGTCSTAEAVVGNIAPHAVERLSANGVASRTMTTANLRSLNTAKDRSSEGHKQHSKQQELLQMADAVAPPTAAAQDSNPGVLSLPLLDGASLPLQPPARSAAARDSGACRSSGSAGGIAAALAGEAAVCRQGAAADLQDNRMSAAGGGDAAGAAAVDGELGEVELLPWSPEGPLLRWDRLLQSR
jgi:hypothetical protein